MLAYRMKHKPVVRQAQDSTPDVLSQVLEDGVNLAVWQRRLPAHIEDFSTLLLSMDQPLAESMTLEVKGGEVEPDLSTLARGYADLQGYQGFIADVSWLVSAYACLLGAECVGLRLRVLDKAMCPRFHVDHVPVRLITTYGGVAASGCTKVLWTANNWVVPKPSQAMLPIFSKSTAVTWHCSRASAGTAMKARA